MVRLTSMTWVVVLSSVVASAPGIDRLDRDLRGAAGELGDRQ